MPAFRPQVVGHPSFSPRIGIVPGYFVAAGVGVDPTDFGGGITAVRQLDAGAVPFFRVTFDVPFRTRLHSLTTTPRALLIADDLTVATGAFTADGPGPGPWPFEKGDIDVILRNAGVATVAAGFRLDFSLLVPA